MERKEGEPASLLDRTRRILPQARLAQLGLALALSGGMAASADALQVDPSSEARAASDTTPIIAVIPGGPMLAGTGGYPEGVAPIVEGLERNGYDDAFALPYYPLPDGKIHLKEWVRNARMIIRTVQKQQNRPVGCLGVSTGGWECAALAAQGDVDLAINVIGPTKLDAQYPANLIFNTPHWNTLGASLQERIQTSPYYRVKSTFTKAAPTLLMYGTKDPLIPILQGEQYFRVAKPKTRSIYDTNTKRCRPDITLTRMEGLGHEFPEQYFNQAVAWLNKRSNPRQTELTRKKCNSAKTFPSNR